MKNRLLVALTVCFFVVSCGSGSSKSDGSTSIIGTSYVRQLAVSEVALSTISVAPKSNFSFIESAYAVTGLITIPEITISREASKYMTKAFSKLGLIVENDICHKYDFVSNIKIAPLVGDDKKLVKGNIYHVYVRSGVIGSGTASDITSGSKYGNSPITGI